MNTPDNEAGRLTEKFMKCLAEEQEVKLYGWRYNRVYSTFYTYVKILMDEHKIRLEEAQSIGEERSNGRGLR